MPALIESVATAASSRKILPKDALRLANDAVARCLRHAERHPSELDILLNAGVYRTKNMAEPALASMIQEDVGANPGHPPMETAHGTFSFDVANGGCGVMTALSLIDGFVTSGAVRLGVVVASDSDPGHRAEFPFANVGGAVLLRPAPPEAGFRRFHFETFPEFVDCYESHVDWHAKEHRFFGSSDGENILEVLVREDFPLRAAECAETAVRRFLQSSELEPGDIDLLLASAYPATFAEEMGRRLGVPLDRIAAPHRRVRLAHTAGVIAALESAVESGRLAAAKNTLFVTVGAGITVGAALYRHSPSGITSAAAGA